MAEILDWSRLKECSFGRADVAEEILEEFANLLCEELAKLFRAVASANWEEARFLAHALKGAGASVGAVKIGETADRLESFAAQRDGPAAEASLVELERQASKFLSWYEMPVRVA